MYTAAVLTAALAGITFAAPTYPGSPSKAQLQPSPTPTYNIFSYDATFDDISNPLALTSNAFVNKYDSLNYPGFGLSNSPTVGTLNMGVVPNSGSNMIAFSNVQSGLTGPQAQITVDYTGSTIDFFHLQSFYFACSVATQETVASAASPCTIQITGVDNNNNTIAGPQSFDFVQQGVMNVPMQLAQVSSDFQNVPLHRVYFEVTEGSGLLVADLLAGLIDSIKYIVYAQGGVPGNSK